MNDHPLTVYWRPGCGFCAALLQGLQRTGLSFARINIWEDDAAAAYVRSVAGGNETVPTVRVGSVSLVNPSAVEVLYAVATDAPDLLPDGYEPPTPGRLVQAFTRMLGGHHGADEVASE